MSLDDISIGLKLGRNANGGRTPTGFVNVPLWDEFNEPILDELNEPILVNALVILEELP